jgi:phosphonate transport system substrate-binding protein
MLSMKTNTLMGRGNQPGVQLLFNCFRFVLLSFATSVIGISNSFADWRDDIGRFRIGIVASGSADKVASEAEPFRLAVEEKLGLPVEILPMANLSRLASAHIDGRVEYAVYPATTYAAAWVNCECIEPVVVARAQDNTINTYFVLIGRTSADRLSVSDLAGKKIWLLTGEEAMGQQFAIHGLRSAGTAVSGGGTGFLVAENPRKALEEFHKGEGDALIGWSSLQGDLAAGYSRGTLKQLAELNEGSISRYQIVWKSGPVPHRTHAIRKNLDGEVKKLLRELLGALFEDDPVAYDAIEPVYGGGFQIATQSQYGAVTDFVRALIPADNENDTGEEPSGGGQESGSNPGSGTQETGNTGSNG